VDEETEIGSYGLDQCIAFVDAALKRDEPAEPLSADWLVGQGAGISMCETIPPGGHFSETRARLLADATYEFIVGTAEFGNGTTTVHGQIAATVLGTDVTRIRIAQSDTAHENHDTGAYGSAGTVVAGKATLFAAQALRDDILGVAAGRTGMAPADCRLERGAVVCGDQRIPLTEVAGWQAFAAKGHSDGMRRSVSFNVQGFRIAVNRHTGAIRILKSVHAADAGTVMNPMQCRGQVEGGMAQGLGAALYETIEMDAEGRPLNHTFRTYHIPSFADVPRTEVFFAATADDCGPLGAKSMSEAPYNPIAAAMGNALRDATGLRFQALPFAADRIYKAIVDKHGG
jgi:CO/xanthine dehydrogenase Mo-binding subunit